MSAAVKLAGFATALAVLFGGAVAVGGAVDADAPGGRADAEPAAGHGGGMADGPQADMVRGLSVADKGVRLVLDDTDFRRGRSEQLRFRIVDDGGAAVRDFDVEHTKRMHVIVARRDLGTFQHLHPTMGADGTWTVPLRLDQAGSYRVFADFSRDDQPITLAGDLRVDGDATLKPLPAPAEIAESDGGYDVKLDAGETRAGRESELSFTVAKDGRPVQVEPYLGADGHLVALRDGDLAFLHVHPSDHGEGGAVEFETTFPTTGRYRLFLQFKHEGRVQTVAFTQEVK